MSRFRKIAKILLPQKVRSKLKTMGDRFLIHTAPLRHHRSLRKLKGKSKIKIAFFVINGAIWKLDELYRKMEEGNKFDPVIIICPYTAFGGEVMQNWMDTAYDILAKRKYHVIKAFDIQKSRWLDVKNEIKPDIVFFTNPHHLTRDEYYIMNYPDCLTCYVPYAFMTPNTYDEQFNQFFHNAVWRAFYETPIHKEIAKKYARNKGTNVVVTGYPGCDPFLDKSHKPEDKWKIKDKNVKRIIWAPHHLMKEGLRPSNFLEYHRIILDMAIKYSGKIQILFKPHPIIKPKLYKYPEWGKIRTDAYFLEWENLGNGQLEEGDYIDIFLTSDALIHDSGSFITEFLFTGKPALYMISNEDVMKGWNEYGEQALSVLYHSRCPEELYYFLEQVVLKENDPMKDVRNAFLNEVLMPPNNLSASENIYNEILKEIK